MANPFRPSAGASPPELIGRQDILDGIGESLDNGPGAPGRITLFAGQRGVGKTVMLNEAAEVAHTRGWRTVELTATPGLLSRLDTEVARILDDEQPRPRRHLTSVSVAGVGGLGFEPTDELASDVRIRIATLSDLLAARGSGLLVSVDEIHGGVKAELRELGAITQHMVREDREFALLMAGLPSAVSNLLADDVLTFLRRADRHTLSELDVDDVQDALTRTIEQNGRRLDPELSRRAAEATRGYPFLVQLVGYHVWRNATSEWIDEAAVDRGTREAITKLGTLVHETALADLSDVDRRFLLAMAEDERKSRMADLAKRMAKDRYYVNNYRRRLIAAQVIEEAGRGYVRFAIPYLGPYLREEYLRT